MALPYFNIGNQKVAVFKHFGAYFYSPFINTTPAGTYTLLQKVKIHNEDFSFNWPSSEQAYHAQKIIHLKSKMAPQDSLQPILTQALFKIQNAINAGQVFMPQQYAALVEELVQLHSPRLGRSKFEFDRLCDADFHSIYAPRKGLNPHTGKPYTLEFMRTIIKLKLEQHPKLKNTAMQLAREGIMPIEVSKHDVNWASGSDGQGLNMLGILILEEGNNLLISQGETPALANPTLSYEQLRTHAHAQLKHDALEPKQQLMKENKSFSQLPCSVPINLPNHSIGHYQYNNPNPQLATKAVYYNEQGARVQGYYKPYRQIHSNWIPATSFAQFDINQFPLYQRSQPPIHALRVEVSPNLEPTHLHTINHATINPKEELIQKLKLDGNNPEHLSFWRNQVLVGGFNFKGHRVPHTIARLMNYIEANKNNQLSYAVFKQGLEHILKEKSSSLSAQLGLSGFFRSEPMKELRQKAQEDCLENSCIRLS